MAAPFIELPTEENKARIAEFQSQISATEHDLKLSVDSAFEGWRAGILADGKPAEGKGLPDGLAAILRKPEANRTDAERKSLDTGLRKHFDDKVRPGLAGKLPAIAKLDGLKKQLAELPRRPAPTRHGDERRKAAPDRDSHSRRIPEAGGESLVFNPELSAAPAQG